MDVKLPKEVKYNQVMVDDVIQRECQLKWWGNGELLIKNQFNSGC